MTHGPSTANRYRRLALSLLGGFCFALASVQVAASGTVRVGVNPTTGYAEVGPRTYSLPPNAKVTPGTGLPSVSVTSGAGLRQSFPSGIEISAIRDPAVKSSFGLGSGLSASAQAVKNAAVRCVTSLKCNFAFAAGAAGLETLFDGIDWVMTDGAVSKRKDEAQPYSSTYIHFGSSWLSFRDAASTPGESCIKRNTSGGSRSGTYQHTGQYRWTKLSNGADVFECHYLRTTNQTYYWDTQYQGSRRGTGCASGFTFNGEFCSKSVWLPATNSEIEQKIQADYIPDPTDWRFILPGLDLAGDGVFIDVSPADSPAAVSLPSIQINPDGSTTETSTSWDFEFLDNPGKQPVGKSTETTTKNDYSSTGQKTGSSSSTTTVVGSSPGSAPIPTPPDIPTDCDFMPTVCRFIDWFKEPDPDSSDPYEQMTELVQVYEDPGTTVAIGPFNAACPAPRTISLSFVPSVEVSFQPFCDLAATVRLWLLAIAYFGAAFVTVRSI